MFVKHLFYSFIVLYIVELFPSIEGDDCNEFICGSVVSKCLLTKSCQCKLSDCYCCKDCLNCLGELYTECCSCLDMCPKHNDTLSAMAPKSQIGDFEGISELFDTLTAEDDEDQWSTVRFPIRYSLQRHYNMATGSFGFSSSIGDVIDREAFINKQIPATVNCTVIYLNTCTTNKKCSQYCESMGSNSYRWFHDGCCECVGANCYNYGINESRCTECPDDDEVVEDDADYGGENENDMSLNYGED